MMWLVVVLACWFVVIDATTLSCVERHMRLGNLTHAVLALPGSARYNHTIAINNMRVLELPRVAVFPQESRHIVLAMEAARACGVQFSVVSGGHSAMGYGLSRDGITVNMRSLQGFSFIRLEDGSRVMSVHAGTRFEHIYAAQMARDGGKYIIVGGGCPGVAIGGFLQGGGWSFLSRSYGLAIDTVVDMDIILANGTITTVSEHAHPDLFWALRGGGGGNFGVVTKFTVRMFEPEPRSSVGVYCWHKDSPLIRGMMANWIGNFSRMPHWLNIDPVWLPFGDAKELYFCMQIICNAVPEKCNPWLEPLKALSPNITTVEVQPYLKWQSNIGNATSDFGGSMYIKSFVFDQRAFTIDLVDIVMDSLRLSPSKENIVLFHVGGGAVAAVPKNATAFPHRDCMVVMQVKAMWRHPSEEADNMAWMQLLAAAVQPRAAGAYVNYIDGMLDDWQTAYYGAEGYKRLLRIKADVDPTNFFRFRQSIGAP